MKKKERKKRIKNKDNYGRKDRYSVSVSFLWQVLLFPFFWKGCCSYQSLHIHTYLLRRMKSSDYIHLNQSVQLFLLFACGFLKTLKTFCFDWDHHHYDWLCPSFSYLLMFFFTINFISKFDSKFSFPMQISPF